MLLGEVGPMSSTRRLSSSLRCLSMAPQPLEWRGMRGPESTVRLVRSGRDGSRLNRLRSTVSSGPLSHRSRAVTVPLTRPATGSNCPNQAAGG